MEKFFNNAGPQQPENYTLDPLRRIKFTEIDALVRQQRYFVLHAPRQTGKTTALYAMMRHYNASKKYRAVYLNVEAGQASRENVTSAIAGITAGLADRIGYFTHDKRCKEWWDQQGRAFPADEQLQQTIRHWCALEPERPAILMIDEIDALIGDTLISVLRQIRAGYNDRPHAFPISLILCGVRDVRDYRIHSSASQEIITGGSAFNIKAESLTLGNFSYEEVQELYRQHTQETGQIFTPQAIDLSWDYTAGQPWLVNALAYTITGSPFHKIPLEWPIDEAQMRRAKEILVLSRATHLDQLVDKLQEPRVRRVIGPLINNQEETADALPDDIQYCSDLGLIRKDGISKRWEIANAIYRETIPRELTWVTQDMLANINPERSWYMRQPSAEQPIVTIDMPKLLRAFQQFYREHSESWLSNMQYKEAAPQLLLQAYLQRVVNGGGYIEREYGLGRGRTDLYIHYPIGNDPVQREVIEIKIKRVKDGMDSLIEKGIIQTRAYMDKCKATQGHLLIFDPSSGKSWDERVFEKPLAPDLMFWGC
jgi:AAA-like domain